MRKFFLLSVLFLFLGWLPATGAEKWKQLTPELPARFITFDWLGGLYAISTDDEMYYLPARSIKWQPLYPGKKVKYLNVFPDGTILALDKTASLGYRRVNGQWTTENGTLQAFLVTKGGSKCMLTTDGKVVYDGKQLMGTYKYISATVQSDGIYLIGMDNKIFMYTKGMSFVTTIQGGGTAKSVVGTGKGVKAGEYCIGAGTDANVYYYDIASPVNKWTKLESNLFMNFIAMNLNGKLYGIGTDNKIYVLAVPY